MREGTHAHASLDKAVHGSSVRLPALLPLQQSASEPLFGREGLGFMGAVEQPSPKPRRKRNRKITKLMPVDNDVREPTNERVLDVFDEVEYHTSRRKPSIEGLEDHKVFWRALGWYHNTAVMKRLESKDYDGAAKAINFAQKHFRSELPPPTRPKSAAHGPERLHALDGEKYQSCISLLQKAKTRQSEQPDVFEQVHSKPIDQTVIRVEPQTRSFTESLDAGDWVQSKASCKLDQLDANLLELEEKEKQSLRIQGIFRGYQGRTRLAVFMLTYMFASEGGNDSQHITIRNLQKATAALTSVRAKMSPTFLKTIMENFQSNDILRKVVVNLKKVLEPIGLHGIATAHHTDGAFAFESLRLVDAAFHARTRDGGLYAQTRYVKDNCFEVISTVVTALKRYPREDVLLIALRLLVFMSKQDSVSEEEFCKHLISIEAIPCILRLFSIKVKVEEPGHGALINDRDTLSQTSSMMRDHKHCNGLLDALSLLRMLLFTNLATVNMSLSPLTLHDIMRTLQQQASQVEICTQCLDLLNSCVGVGIRLGDLVKASEVAEAVNVVLTQPTNSDKPALFKKAVMLIQRIVYEEAAKITEATAEVKVSAGTAHLLDSRVLEAYTVAHTAACVRQNQSILVYVTDAISALLVPTAPDDPFKLAELQTSECSVSTSNSDGTLDAWLHQMVKMGTVGAIMAVVPQHPNWRMYACSAMRFIAALGTCGEPLPNACRGISLLIGLYASTDPSLPTVDEQSNKNLSEIVVVSAAIKAMHAVAGVAENAHMLVEGQAIEQLCSIVGEHRDEADVVHISLATLPLLLREPSDLDRLYSSCGTCLLWYLLNTSFLSRSKSADNSSSCEQEELAVNCLDVLVRMLLHKPGHRELWVEIISANGLAQADVSARSALKKDKSDPYTAVFYNGIRVGCTRTIQNSHDPVWKQSDLRTSADSTAASTLGPWCRDATFCISASTSFTESWLRMEVRDWDGEDGGMGDLLGCIHVSGEEILQNTEDGLGMSSKQDNGSDEITWRKEASLNVALVRKPHTNEVTKLKAAGGNLMVGLSLALTGSHLRVRVIGATNLAKADAGRGSKSDPYVCAFWNDIIVGRTPPKIDDHHPRWAEDDPKACFTVEVLPYNDTRLRLEVRDEDDDGVGECLGSICVRGSELKNHIGVCGVEKRKYKLRPMKDNNESQALVKGSLTFRLQAITPLAIVRVMQLFPRHRMIQFRGCIALNLLASSAEGVRSVVFAGGCTALVHALELGLGATVKQGIFLDTETQEKTESGSIRAHAHTRNIRKEQGSPRTGRSENKVVKTIGQSVFQLNVRQRRVSNALVMSTAYASVSKSDQPINSLQAERECSTVVTDKELQEVALTGMTSLVDNNPRSIELMLQHYDKGDASSESVVGLLYALLRAYHDFEKLIKHGCVPALATMMLRCPRNDKVQLLASDALSELTSRQIGVDVVIESPAHHSWMRQVVMTILSAKGLPRADGAKGQADQPGEVCELIISCPGRSDPYCLCFWNGVKVFRSSTVMDNCDPKWKEGNQVMLGLLPSLNSSILRVEVHDHDDTGVGDFLGEVEIRGKELRKSLHHITATSTRCEYDLQRKAVGSEIKPVSGRLAFFINLHSTELHLTILSGHELANADARGKSDPYCMVFWNDKFVGETAVINDTLHPVWGPEHNREFVIPLLQSKSPKQAAEENLLRIEVRDEDDNGLDELLGQVMVDNKAVLDQIHAVRPQRGAGGDSKLTGLIKLGLDSQLGVCEYRLEKNTHSSEQQLVNPKSNLEVRFEPVEAIDTLQATFQNYYVSMMRDGVEQGVSATIIDSFTERKKETTSILMSHIAQCFTNIARSEEGAAELQRVGAVDATIDALNDLSLFSEFCIQALQLLAQVVDHSEMASVKLEVTHASDLAQADMDEREMKGKGAGSDPYVDVFWCGNKIFETVHIPDQMNPVWKDQFCFIPLPSLDDLRRHNCYLKCVVRDFDEDGTHDFLGQIQWDWTELLRQVVSTRDKTTVSPKTNLRPRRASLVDLFNSADTGGHSVSTATGDVSVSSEPRRGTAFKLERTSDTGERQIVKGHLGVSFSRLLHAGHDRIIHPRMFECLAELVWQAELRTQDESAQQQQEQQDQQSIEHQSSRAIVHAKEIEKAALHLLHLMTNTRPRIRRLFECSALDPDLSIPAVLRRVAQRYGKSPLVTSLVIAFRTVALQWQAKNVQGVETDEIVFAKMLQQYNKMTSIDRLPDLSNFKMLAPRALTMLSLYLDCKVAVGQHVTEEGMALAVTAINTCAADVGVNSTACKVLRRLVKSPHDWEGLVAIGGLRSLGRIHRAIPISATTEPLLIHATEVLSAVLGGGDFVGSFQEVITSGAAQSVVETIQNAHEEDFPQFQEVGKRFLSLLVESHQRHCASKGISSSSSETELLLALAKKLI